MTIKPRARDHGLTFGTGQTGPKNAITDVPGVSIGHVTLKHPPRFNTGVTAIMTGADPLHRLPAGLSVGNGFGKLIGATQLAELGQLESPIILTATLSAFKAADSVVSWMLGRDEFARVTTFNPVVGECNDAELSDIRARPITQEHVLTAMSTATTGPVEEGCVGAGTGTSAMGFKAGIGTASRVIQIEETRYTIGGIVQANFGGVVRLKGIDIPAPSRTVDEGSCMLVLATDAPLDSRQLNRVANRAVFGLGRVGASYSHGSGDYGIAVSTQVGNIIDDEHLNPVFAAALDIVEEMVMNALVAAVPTEGFKTRSPAITDAPQWRNMIVDT